MSKTTPNMKKVINPDQTSNTINLDEISNSSIVGARTGNERFQCFNEPSGYIFRSIRDNLESGHSGFHSTKHRAVEWALTVGNTEVFVFDSYKELYKWMLSETN